MYVAFYVAIYILFINPVYGPIRKSLYSSSLGNSEYNQSKLSTTVAP